MRVLIVSQCFWPENFRINSVTKSLSDAGCHVEILTGQPNYPDGEVFPGYVATGFGREDHDGMRINRVPIFPRGRGGSLRLTLNYLSFIVSGLFFGMLAMRQRKFDVVFVYGTSPILQALPAVALAWLKRAAIVLWVQDLWPQSLEVTGFVRNRLVLDAVAVVVGWIYRRCDLILVQSQTFEPIVRRMAGGTPVIVHQNPGDQPAAEIVETVHLDGEFVVVFAGNLGTVQSLETILDAADMLRDRPGVRFAFVGSGARSSWLAEQISRRRLDNCAMVGRVPVEAMPGIFAQAAVLLVTLVRGSAMEMTVPSKVQAYLAAGKPIIAALDGEGARVVAASGGGIVCPAEQPAALAAAVRQLFEKSAAERCMIGMAGRRYFDAHFAPGVMTPRLLAAFERAISRRRRHPRTAAKAMID